MVELGVTIQPDYVIDDHVEMFGPFTGSPVPEPMLPLDRDTVMWRVYDEIQAHVSRLEAG